MSTASGFAEALSRNFLLFTVFMYHIHLVFYVSFKSILELFCISCFVFFYIVLLKEEFDNHRKRDVCYLTCTGDSHEQFT